MINLANFVFDILCFFLAVSIPFVLFMGFLILYEKWQERNEIKLDNTDELFRQPIKHKLKN